MIVNECFRIDYPEWSYGGNSYSRRHDENEPLGLFLGPSGPALSGLRLQIANDAEQIEVYLDTVENLLSNKHDYFGEPNHVPADSPLRWLLGQSVQHLFLAQHSKELSGHQSIAVRLVFERDALTFLNNGDEGYYLVQANEDWALAANPLDTSLYPDLQWVEYATWLKLLGVPLPDLPRQLV